MKILWNYGKNSTAVFFPLLVLLAMLTICIISSAQTNAVDNLKVTANAHSADSSVIKDNDDQLNKDKISPKDGKVITSYSSESVLLVGFVLLLLLMIFFLLMNWSQRSDRLSYLGIMYRDTLKDIEYKRLRANLSDKLNSGEYEREITNNKEFELRPEPPDCFYRPSSSQSGDGLGRSNFDSKVGSSSYGNAWDADHGGLGDARISLSEPEKKELQDYHKKLDEWKRKLEAEVQRYYQEDLGKAMKKADTLAGLAIDIDLSVLRGRGPEFVLEFTAVVVIIFSAVILGILKILDTQQIGTLLAAIAGYVLGRATQRTRNEPTQADLQRKSDNNIASNSNDPNKQN